MLIRSTNWIGDAIMTLPAIQSIRKNFPTATINVLAHPWVADIFSANPNVDKVIIYHKKGKHAGLVGMWKLSQELAKERFDLAILLQNAFEAALLTRLAGIPVIAGFNRDARGLLLTHSVLITQEIRSRHQVYYYQYLLACLGLDCAESKLKLWLSEEDTQWAEEYVGMNPGPIFGLNPGAAYGPAKCWPVERYGEMARRLLTQFGGTAYVFGTAADNKAAETISAIAGDQVIDLTGKTSLSRAMALIGKCDAFITNDSGLMHVAAAQNTPLVAIFGSTDAVATGPFSERAVVVSKSLSCSPCFKTHCPFNFECMTAINVDDVEGAVSAIISSKN
ncbi:MAG: lipopolysaccharide heptosyltransferase II [Desulfobulbaceae bacterium]|nr:lipopolysaccharide heptosyltransferase II [Desulfobulbaceae bacterium]